jgi:ADP-heptose:LPS heptosyltransferase
MNRILVVRGGAIGDFILTLPALKALRGGFPEAAIEILGYKHIAELARNRFYADQVRSIEYGPLATFFGRNSELPSDLADYFAGFDLVISYLYDPDLIFEMNLRRCGVEEIVRGPGKLTQSEHAAQQLARPMTELGLELSNLVAQVFPSNEDRQWARDFRPDASAPLIAIHPGSGSEKKNWPIENWIELGNQLLASDNFRGSILVVGGEADEVPVSRLESTWQDSRVSFVRNLPLTQLAALLETSTFLGHDSGISHLAAAAGAKCLLLFGPTDPEIWAPRGDNVKIIPAPGGDLERLKVATVRAAALV